jgi:hypothetical protein
VFPSTDPARSDLLDNQEMQRSNFRQPALPARSALKASNPAMTQQQINDQDDEQNAAYADPATVTVTPIAETASEQQKQYDDD